MNSSSTMDGALAGRGDLLDRVAAGDVNALGDLIEPHRKRLRHMVSTRIDRRLQSRLDPSDVVQEACLDAARRVGEYVRNQTVPFYVWLRLIAEERLIDQYRRHVGAKARSISREIHLHRRESLAASSAELAKHWVDCQTSPSEAAARDERRLRLHSALESLEPIDREILALRHFEQMSNGEAAAALGMNKSAASKRYVRALTKLRRTLRVMSDAADEQF